MNFISAFSFRLFICPVRQASMQKSQKTDPPQRTAAAQKRVRLPPAPHPGGRSPDPLIAPPQIDATDRVESNGRNLPAPPRPSPLPHVQITNDAYRYTGPIHRFSYLTIAARWVPPAIFLSMPYTSPVNARLLSAPAEKPAIPGNMTSTCSAIISIAPLRHRLTAVWPVRIPCLQRSPISSCPT